MKTHQKILIIVALVSFFSCFIVMLSNPSFTSPFVKGDTPSGTSPLIKGDGGGFEEKNILETQHPIPEYITNNQHYLVKIFSKQQFTEKGQDGGLKNSVIISLGHGILLNNEGYILTNKHVVQDMVQEYGNSLYVSVDDQEYRVENIWRDEQQDSKQDSNQDLALIKIAHVSEDDSNMPVFQNTSSSGAIENDIPVWVVTSAKIVSGTARLLSGEWQTNISGKSGDSGSILCDDAGNIIGINTEINLDDNDHLYAIALSQNSLQKILKFRM